MATQRVVIVWTHKLFRDSVRLLLNDPKIDCAGATSDYVSARQLIAELKPDAVIVEEMEEETSSMVLDIVKSCGEWVRVVGLSFATNQLSIYQHRQHEMRQAEDLLKLILVEPTSGGKE